MSICQTPPIVRAETRARCEYLAEARGLGMAELDRGVPYSDLRGKVPVFKTTGVGEHDRVLSSQEIDRAAVSLAEQDFVKTALAWFNTGPSRGIFANTTTQALRATGLTIDWLPDGGPLLLQTLQKIDRLKSSYRGSGLMQNNASYRAAMACGIMKFHQKLGISFRNIPGAPVAITHIHPGQKLECQSYAGLYYSAALLAGLSPRWMEAIWSDTENTHLYIAVPLQDHADATLIYVDLMTGTCGQDNPFSEATTRELSPLEVLAGYAVARGGEKELEKARQFAPQDYQAQYTSAFWYFNHGNGNLGRHYLERALQIFPTMPRSNDVRDILSQLTPQR